VSQICNEIVSFGGAMGISSRIDLVLNLAPNQGGSRKLENREIRNIVAALKENTPCQPMMKSCSAWRRFLRRYATHCGVRLLGFESSRR
jgi:hypothetical protein